MFFILLLVADQTLVYRNVETMVSKLAVLALMIARQEPAVLFTHFSPKIIKFA